MIAMIGQTYLSILSVIIPFVSVIIVLIVAERRKVQQVKRDREEMMRVVRRIEEG